MTGFLDWRDEIRATLAELRVLEEAVLAELRRECREECEVPYLTWWRCHGLRSDGHQAEGRGPREQLRRAHDRPLPLRACRRCERSRGRRPQSAPHLRAQRPDGGARRSRHKTEDVRSRHARSRSTSAPSARATPVPTTTPRSSVSGTSAATKVSPSTPTPGTHLLMDHFPDE